MKDIFIDNDVATKHFSNPIDEDYKKLIDWLKTFNNDVGNDAHLVLSSFLHREYIESNRNPNSQTNIVAIINEMVINDRINRVKNQDIKRFQTEHFTKNVLKKMTSNAKDRNHIPAVLLSNRKMALSEDSRFLNDLIQIKGFKPIAAFRPENIDYKD
jgi:poly-D-alanine transfer protein DltD